MSAASAVQQPRAARAAIPRDPIDGVLLLDKPRGLSSSQAMLVCRRLLGAAKAGHGGTLDPMASGLLPILVGEATKFAHDLLDADKTYAATLHLGQTSTTGDAEGQIVATGKALPTEAELVAALQRFEGPIAQRPPMHSALKHQGRPLYDYARSGLDVERATRTVTIHRIDLLAVEGELVRLRVRCSKGTYIRTLAEDIGEAAGCGAWLSDLRREAVESLSLENGVSLDGLEALDLAERRKRLMPLDALLQRLPVVELDATAALRLVQGQRLRLAPRTDSPPQRVRVVHANRLLGVAMLDGGVLISQRLIAAPTSG